MWAEIPWNISDLKVYKAKRLTTNTEFDFLFFIYADNKKKWWTFIVLHELQFQFRNNFVIEMFSYSHQLNKTKNCNARFER